MAHQYDPGSDLYAVLGVDSDASPDEIRRALWRVRDAAGTPDAGLDQAEALLLNADARTRYNVQRAAYRLRRLLRAGFRVFAETG